MKVVHQGSGFALYIPTLYTTLLVITLKVMVKPNAQTKHWNSTSESSATINKITGIPCYHLPSLPITTLLARLLAYPHSSLTKAIILILPFTPNETSPPPKQRT